MIPPTKVVLPGRDEIMTRIAEVLDSGMLSQGKNVEEFEQRFREEYEFDNAVAVSNGGVALEAILRSIGVQGMDVIVPTNTFFATASAVLMAGGNPVLCDINPGTMSPDEHHVNAVVTESTIAVIMVHVGGVISPQICDIREWCNENNIFLIEDCAHAHGSSLNGLGAGHFGHAGAFSFFPTKVLTSGEGGMVVTNDPELAKLIEIQRDYGKPERWVSHHTHIGANWRMNDLEGAVGAVQMEYASGIIIDRETTVHRYQELVREAELPFLPIGQPSEVSGYKAVFLIPREESAGFPNPGWLRGLLAEEMQDAGVKLSGGVYDLPLHRQPVFKEMYEETDSFPGADFFCESHICLPIWYGVKGEEIERVVSVLADAWKTVRG